MNFVKPIVRIMGRLFNYVMGGVVMRIPAYQAVISFLRGLCIRIRKKFVMKVISFLKLTFALFLNRIKAKLFNTVIISLVLPQHAYLLANNT